jgi:molybdenum cofactor biosynthesis protein B
MDFASPSTEHKKKFAGGELRCAVLTISSSKTAEDDVSGNLAKNLLKNAGITILFYKIIPDAEGVIRDEIQKLAEGGIDAIITTGGTGLTPDDVTIESVRPILKKEIEGFGELFRAMSFEEIGSSAVLTRALAGVVDRTVVFCLPGSPNAVQLALEKLILPEMHHMVGHIRAKK